MVHSLAYIIKNQEPIFTSEKLSNKFVEENNNRYPW